MFPADLKVGRVYLAFDNAKKLVHVTVDQQQSTFDLPYPPQYTGTNSLYGSFSYIKKRNQIFLCVNSLFLIDLEVRQFDQIDSDPCTLSLGGWNDIVWSPDGSLIAYNGASRFYAVDERKQLSIEDVAKRIPSWTANWSPDWRYNIDVTRSDTRCPNPPTDNYLFASGNETALVVQERQSKTERVLFCSAWESLNLITWLDHDRLLIDGVIPVNHDPPVFESYVASMSTGKVTSLGLSMEWQGIYLDHNARYARIRADYSDSGISDSALNIVDLKTLKNTDVEPTFWWQPSDMAVLAPQHQLIYLYSPIPPDNPHARTIELHLVDLNTLHVTALPLRNINEIVGATPDGRYVTLIGDTPHSDQRDVFHQMAFEHPQVLIYDTQQARIVYRRPQPSGWDEGINWSPTSKALFLDTGSQDTPGLYLVLLTPDVADYAFPDALNTYVDWSTTSFETVDRRSVWSPSGNYLLIFTEKGAQVVPVADPTIRIPITTLLEKGDQLVNVEWYGHDQLLVEVFSKKGVSTIHRWIIDPAHRYTTHS